MATFYFTWGAAISEVIIDNETAYIYKLIDIEEPYIQEFDNVVDKVNSDFKKYKEEIFSFYS